MSHRQNESPEERKKAEALAIEEAKKVAAKNTAIPIPRSLQALLSLIQSQQSQLRQTHSKEEFQTESSWASGRTRMLLKISTSTRLLVLSTATDYE